MMTDNRSAADRAAYEKTGNPLHVWFAIGRYAADEPLPLWVRRYLLKITRELWRLALDRDVSPAAAQKEILQALGFGEQGRNVVAEVRQRREDSFPVALYDLGVPARDLADALGNPQSDQEVRMRSFRKRVARVRKTQSKRP
jgi:hypothetical protein